MISMVLDIGDPALAGVAGASDLHERADLVLLATHWLPCSASTRLSSDTFDGYRGCLIQMVALDIAGAIQAVMAASLYVVVVSRG